MTVFPSTTDHDYLDIPGLSRDEAAKIPLEERKLLASIEPPKLWERQRDESARAFLAFTFYRDLGPRRTLIQAARFYYDDPERRDAGSVHKWFHEHMWATRASEYDRHVDRQRLEAELENQRLIQQSHMGVAAAMMQKVLSRIQIMDDRDLNTRDIPNWAIAAQRLDRTARGQAVESLEISMTHEQQAALASPPTKEDLLAELARALGVNTRDPEQVKEFLAAVREELPGYGTAHSTDLDLVPRGEEPVPAEYREISSSQEAD